MNRYAPAALLLLLTCAPALAQSAPYSFDNFDVVNGVRIYSEPAKSRAPVRRSQRKVENTTATKPDREVISTVLVYPAMADGGKTRSEEHTSELQSPYDLVCRLLLEKKNSSAFFIGLRDLRANLRPI